MSTTNSPKNESDREEKDGIIDLLSADIFHKDDDQRKKVPWNKMSKEERVESLKEYFEREFNNDSSEKTLNKDTIEMLLAEAEKGKLKTKKEVLYDEVNRRVIRLTILSAEPHTDHYIYKPESLTQREKSRKSARNKLFRRNRKR